MMPDGDQRGPAREWQIGVFCHNEEARIDACLASIAAAVGGQPARITVILNGSTDGSERLACATASTSDIPTDVISIAYADKSNAINRFFYDLRIEADMYVCVDAYCVVAPTSLRAMAARLTAGDALAVSGIAVNGRTEPSSTRATVEVGGVLRGQLYALHPEFVRRTVAAGLKLPVGLYRGDGLLGSMCAHDLDAIGHPWADRRIAGVPEAMFEIVPLSPLQWRDWRRQFRRKVRQMRGLIENAAIKDVIYRSGYAALPANADDMIRDYLSTHGAPPVGWLDRPFMALALRNHRRTTRPNEEELRPKRIHVSGRR